jgi:uroporphyrinogen decarboxylase
MKVKRMNKRDAILGLADGHEPPYIPAAFFLHFPPAFHSGQAAVDKHLEFYRYTGMDFVKIQYEAVFPPLTEIETPADWVKMPCYGQEFYEGQLAAVKGIVEAVGREAAVVVTLYSPFMCAAHTVGYDRLTDHLNRDPEKVFIGLEVVTDSLLGFVRACIGLGVDGFYTSTQGGEAGRFSDAGCFAQFIKPFDLALMEEPEKACPFNILHVCDFFGDYDDFAPFLDYPGAVVSSPLKMGTRELTPKEASDIFHRPYMGGLDRKGAITRGTQEEIRRTVAALIATAPTRFILGADCTVPAKTSWDNIKAAVDAAHEQK